MGVSALTIIPAVQTPIGKDLSVFSDSHFSKTCFINSDLLLTPSKFDIALFEELSFGLFSMEELLLLKLYRELL